MLKPVIIFQNLLDLLRRKVCYMGIVMG